MTSNGSEFRDKYAAFWAPEEEHTEKEYLEKLSKGQIWGGDFELTAISNILRANIIVLDADNSYNNWIVLYLYVHLSHTHILPENTFCVFRGGNHYDSLVSY